VRIIKKIKIKKQYNLFAQFLQKDVKTPTIAHVKVVSDKSSSIKIRYLQKLAQYFKQIKIKL
jgi:hypothetical protein